MKEVMIKIEGLTKRYGDTEVLQNIDMEIQKGEIYGIIGRSGVGKSTLLRCINGLEKYQGGRLLVEGTDIDSLTEKTPRIPQKYRHDFSAVFST